MEMLTNINEVSLGIYETSLGNSEKGVGKKLNYLNECLSETNLHIWEQGMGPGRES